MQNADSSEYLNSFTLGAKWVIDATRQLLDEEHEGEGALGLTHWLLSLTGLFGGLIKEFIPYVNETTLKNNLQQKLRRGDSGFPLDIQTVAARALEIAEQNGDEEISPRELASAILSFAGYKLPDQSSEEKITEEYIDGRINELFLSFENKDDSVLAGSNNSTFEKLGRNLSRAARDGKLNQIVGREEEIQLIIETLLRKTKRNPILVGPAGSGKTAIVEGLAQKIIRGEVPKQLRVFTIYELQPSVIVANNESLDQTMNDVVKQASGNNIILFIDEIHTIVGRGGLEGISDIASILKPALARGDIACIGATTEGEYRRFIEPDSALERRFQPIRIQSLNADQTLDILFNLRKGLSGINISDDVLQWLVYFAQQFLHNRNFPDKAVDLFEQCVAHAIIIGKNEVDRDTASAVAQRMVGIPIDVERRLNHLEVALKKTISLQRKTPLHY